MEHQEIEVKRGYENIEGATKAGRPELIYTSNKDSRAPDDLPVLDESRHRHRPMENMAGANRISGYDGELRLSQQKLMTWTSVTAPYLRFWP